MNRVVVDSSVVVKWYVRSEPLQSPAQKLKQIFQKGEKSFIVPDLLFYEVANVFLKKWRENVNVIQGAFSTLWQLPWLLMPLRQSLLLRTLEIASLTGTTFYDALFVATAEKAEADFYTADLELLRKMKQFPFVKGLEAIQ